MGTVFLLILLTQRCCCRRRMDKDETGRRAAGRGGEYSLSCRMRGETMAAMDTEILCYLVLNKILLFINS